MRRLWFVAKQAFSRKQLRPVQPDAQDVRLLDVDPHELYPPEEILPSMTDELVQSFDELNQLQDDFNLCDRRSFYRQRMPSAAPAQPGPLQPSSYQDDAELHVFIPPPGPSTFSCWDEAQCPLCSGLRDSQAEKAMLKEGQPIRVGTALELITWSHQLAGLCMLSAFLVAQLARDLGDHDEVVPGAGVFVRWEVDAKNTEAWGERGRNSELRGERGRVLKSRSERDLWTRQGKSESRVQTNNDMVKTLHVSPGTSWYMDDEETAAGGSMGFRSQEGGPRAGSLGRRFHRCGGAPPKKRD